MTHLYLIRHGRTAWNHTDRLQGWADEPLDAVGRAQSAALAAALRAVPFDAIYTSPLRRARETAEAIAQTHGQSPRLDDRLRERNVGDWTGLTLAQARAQMPDRFDGDWRQAGAPGGESQAALVARLAAALDDTAYGVAAHPLGTVALVSHGGALSALLTHVLGIPATRTVSFSFHNTAFARMNIQPGHNGPGLVRLLSLGDDRHLDGLSDEPADL